MENKLKIRMGMVGGGQDSFFGAVHRRAAALDGDIELVCGAFSRDLGNNRRTGAALGLDAERIYDSWEEMIDAESRLPATQRVQMISVVTPNHLHIPVSAAALEAGFHVMSEKPMARSLKEARTLVDVHQNSGCLFGLAYTYLGYPMVWQARNMVQDGTIGRLRKIYVEYPQGWLSREQAADNKQAAWRTDPAIAGASGCMGDIGTHAFALAEFVSCQHITSLCGDLNVTVPGRRLDDDGAALFRCSGGASGVLIASQVCSGKANDLKIQLYGEKGGLEWRHCEPNTLIHSAQASPARYLQAGTDNSYLTDEALQRCRLPAGHPEGFSEALANLYLSFSAAIRSSKQLDAPGVPGLATGLRGMAFLEAIIESAASKEKWFDLTDTGQPASAAALKG